MTGKLTGIGVGPGDPELMTLKAVRCIERCDVVLTPDSEKKNCAAYEIARGAVPQIEEKMRVSLPMPMTKDKQRLAAAHEKGQQIVEALLKEGKKLVFLTLGDPTVYSTYLYIHKRIKESGYSPEIISGIPSFCAAAARLNIGLAEGKEEIHIIPASYDIQVALQLSGTRIFMKAGSEMKTLKAALLKSGAQAAMVENCGMEGEAVYYGAEQIPDDAGYYSLVIVK